MNFLVNAAQAIKGEGVIQINTYTKDQYAVIEIADNGSGIPANVINSILDPFFTTKPVGQGTGLGLSISFRIIEDHNGQIFVKSKVGEGTVFTIHLPLYQKR